MELPRSRFSEAETCGTLSTWKDKKSIQSIGGLAARVVGAEEGFKLDTLAPSRKRFPTTAS